MRGNCRTFLQQKYYFNSKEEYAKLLKEYLEIRPFKLKSEGEELGEGEGEGEEKENSIDFKNIVEFPTPDIRDENLYVPKTRVLKDKLPEKVEEFKKLQKM